MISQGVQQLVQDASKLSDEEQLQFVVALAAAVDERSIRLLDDAWLKEIRRREWRITCEPLATSNAALNPTEAIVNSSKGWRKHFQKIAGGVSLAALFFTAYIVFDAWRQQSRGPIYCLLFLWAFLAPLAFWFEFYYVYRKFGRPGTLELFKYGQQVSAALWAGLLAALFAIGSSDHFKTDDRGVPPQEAKHPIKTGDRGVRQEAKS